MFGSAELDCQSSNNDVRIVKKLAMLKAEDAGGGRLQALLLAYSRHEAILIHEVDFSRYDLDRRLYQSTPVALFRLDYTFERDRVGTVRVLTAFTCFAYLCVCGIYSYSRILYSTCDFTSKTHWAGSGAAGRASSARGPERRCE